MRLVNTVIHEEILASIPFKKRFVVLRTYKKLLLVFLKKLNFHKILTSGKKQKKTAI